MLNYFTIDIHFICYFLLSQTNVLHMKMQEWEYMLGNILQTKCRDLGYTPSRMGRHSPN
jgi:hypothetical protein